MQEEGSFQTEESLSLQLRCYSVPDVQLRVTKPFGKRYFSCFIAMMGMLLFLGRATTSPQSIEIHPSVMRLTGLSVITKSTPFISRANSTVSHSLLLNLLIDCMLSSQCHPTNVVSSSHSRNIGKQNTKLSSPTTPKLPHFPQSTMVLI